MQRVEGVRCREDPRERATAINNRIVSILRVTDSKTENSPAPPVFRVQHPFLTPTPPCHAWIFPPIFHPTQTAGFPIKARYVCVSVPFKSREEVIKLSHLDTTLKYFRKNMNNIQPLPYRWFTTNYIFRFANKTLQIYLISYRYLHTHSWPP